MSKRIADLIIKLGADSYEFQQKVREVDKGLSKLSKNLDKIGKDLSLKLSAPLLAIGAISLKVADDQAKATVKVQQAIKSTGGAAKIALSEFQSLAAGLQSKTLFDDDQIMNEVTAQLLTFTNIAGENFKRTQTVALDLATVLDGDLKSASIQLGKALNDPVKNLSALSRSGIQFSKEQTATIKNLAETNRLAQAQGVILAELERQYGGQAQAAAKVGLGALTQLKNNWGDFLEQIGNIMMPLINKIAGALSDIIFVLQGVNPQFLELIVVVSGVAAAIGPLLLTISSVIKILPMLAVGFTAIISPVGLLVGAIMALGGAFLYAHMQKKKMLENMTDDFSQLATSTLESQLKENRRKQTVNEMESPWQGDSPYSKLVYATNKGRRRDELKMEEEALTEAIKRNKRAKEERDKTKEDTERVAKSMKDALAKFNIETERTSGLINNIKTEIENLENKKLLPKSTFEDIAEANDKISELKEQLASLGNISLKRINNTKTASTPDGIKSITPEQIAPKIEVKLPDLSSMVNKAHEQMRAIRDSVRDGIFGWADDMSSGLQENITETENIVSNYTAALVGKGWKFSEALTQVFNQVAMAMKGFEETINKFITNSIVVVSETIGGMIVGDLGLNDLLSTILSQIGQFLKQIGSQLIEFGVMMIAFKFALKSVLANPWIAIGVGAAMVAAGAIMTSLIQKNAKKNAPKLAKGGLAYGATYAMVGDNPNAKVDPEVIAPLSKLKGLMSQGGSQNVSLHLTGELKAKGRDLVYVLGKENFKLGIIGG